MSEKKIKDMFKIGNKVRVKQSGCIDSANYKKGDVFSVEQYDNDDDDFGGKILRLKNEKSTWTLFVGGENLPLIEEVFELFEVHDHRPETEKEPLRCVEYVPLPNAPQIATPPRFSIAEIRALTPGDLDTDDLIKLREAGLL